MKNRNRRTFLKNVTLTVGAIALGQHTVLAFPPFQGKQGRARPKPADQAEFLYQPADWQSPLNFPNDSYRTVLSKRGDLLSGLSLDANGAQQASRRISFQLEGEELSFTSQKSETPSLPIVTTMLDGQSTTTEIVAFASNLKDEGRVDNLIITVRAKSGQQSSIHPMLIVESTDEFSIENDDDSDYPNGGTAFITLTDTNKTPVMILDAMVNLRRENGKQIFELSSQKSGKDGAYRYFLRFPYAVEDADEIKEGLENSEKILTAVRTSWPSTMPATGKVNWDGGAVYQPFIAASVRHLAQSREVKANSTFYHAGPVTPATNAPFRIMPAHFMAEAARYIGDDAVAEGLLRKIWDLQTETGAVVGADGEGNLKDTAVAVYSLVRHADLAQNYDYFNELFPDAVKAVMYLHSLREKSIKDGTPNGNYGIMPKALLDGGTEPRAEIATTLWTMMAMKSLMEIADRFFLPYKAEIRGMYGQVRTAFVTATNGELRTHPQGTSYLPMILKDDSLWTQSDQSASLAQRGLLFLAQSIYPGLLFPLEPKPTVVRGFMDLTRYILQEDVPIGTGPGGSSTFATADALGIAQALIWAGMPDEARKIVIGVLNHASPLHGWWSEQTIGVSPANLRGLMPDNWAAAEIIRTVRHMLIMEDEGVLRLLDGVREADLQPQVPLRVIASPTRWGRITLTHEPVDAKTWLTKFTREDFNAEKMPKLNGIQMPRKLLPDFQFDKITGTTAVKNGPRVYVKPDAMQWECTWRNFRRS